MSTSEDKLAWVDNLLRSTGPNAPFAKAQVTEMVKAFRAEIDRLRFQQKHHDLTLTRAMTRIDELGMRVNSDEALVKKQKKEIETVQKIVETVSAETSRKVEHEEVELRALRDDIRVLRSELKAAKELIRDEQERALEAERRLKSSENLKPMHVLLTPTQREALTEIAKMYPEGRSKFGLRPGALTSLRGYGLIEQSAVVKSTPEGRPSYMGSSWRLTPRGVEEVRFMGMLGFEKRKTEDAQVAQR